MLVANETLRGSSVLDQSLVLQYVNFADNEILPAVCAWVFPTLGVMPQDQKVCPCDPVLQSLFLSWELLAVILLLCNICNSHTRSVITLII